MDEQDPPDASSSENRDLDAGGTGADPSPSPGPSPSDADDGWGAAGDGDYVPGPWELEGPAVSISLGDACDVDPALLAAMTGPAGLGGELLSDAFGEDGPADGLRPGPVLAALAEQAVSEVTALSDDQLTGALQAARRLENRSVYLQSLAVAEFARRRAAQLADAKARKVPKGRRPGEFPVDELASELAVTGYQADARISHDLALTSRLPMTLAGMAAGLISGNRADTIAAYTASLTDDDAAYADGVLAPAAPGLRADQLARKAAALELKLNPEGVKARREHARQTRQRVEFRREDSGNASIAGRELDTVDALASKAYMDALAVRIRNSGLAEGPLGAIRTRVMMELLQGRNPLDLIAPDPPAAEASDNADLRDPDDPGPDCPDDIDDYDSPGDPGDPGDLDDDGPGYTGPDGAPAWTPGEPAPPPATLNLTIPIGTLLGWSTAPAQAGGFGLLDPEETRSLVEAASRHPRTRWSVTLIDASGQAVAHGRARGQHPWNPYPPGAPPPAAPPPGTSSSSPPPASPPPPSGPPPTPPQAPSPQAPSPQAPPPPGPPPPPRGGVPDAAQAAQLRDLIRALKVTFDPVARGTCNHAQAEDRYTPSRRLRDLIRARTATCDAPGCNAQAVYCDCDHTTPWPQGPTDQCNLGPKCRRHHRCKQAPGWKVTQPEPGITRWTLPSGRHHTTTPTTYDF